MNRLKMAAIVATVLMAGCASYNAFEKGRSAERTKNWDEAVIQYQKALEIDPDNVRYQMNLQRAKLEASPFTLKKARRFAQRRRRPRERNGSGWNSSLSRSSRSP